MRNFIMITGIPSDSIKKFADLLSGGDNAVLITDADTNDNIDVAISLINQKLDDKYDVVFMSKISGYETRKEFLSQLRTNKKQCYCLLKLFKDEEPSSSDIEAMRYFTIPIMEEGWDYISLFPETAIIGSRRNSKEIVDKVKNMSYKRFEKLGVEKIRYSVSEHCKACGDYLLNTIGDSEDFNVVIAGYLHGIGNKYSKYQEKKDFDGCDYQNISAYLAASYLARHRLDSYDIIEISKLIGWHTKISDFKLEKSAKDYTKFFGESDLTKLISLHKADNLAKIV